MSNARYNLFPSKPAFHVASSSANFATNADHVGKFNLVRSDAGGDFNTTNNRFTAPVDGKYYISSSIQVDNGGSGSNQVHILGVTIRKNGVNFKDQYQGRSNLNYITVVCSGVLDLSEGDYVDIYVKIHAQCSVEYTGGTDRCTFSGYLVS